MYKKNLTINICHTKKIYEFREKNKIFKSMNFCYFLFFFLAFLLLSALAGQHVDEGLHVDEAFVVDFHVFKCVVDFFGGEFVAVFHQRCPESAIDISSVMFGLFARKFYCNTHLSLSILPRPLSKALKALMTTSSSSAPKGKRKSN